MSTLVLEGHLSVMIDEPLRVRVSAGGAPVEAPVATDGSFRLEVPIPAGATAPDAAALERELALLYELADLERGAPEELLRQLGGAAPSASAPRRALGLHALAQGDELLEAWGAGPAREAWLNARLDVLAGASEPLAQRPLHISDELAGHVIALSVELPVPEAALAAVEARGEWRDTLQDLWSKCHEGEPEATVVDWPLLRLSRGTKARLRHALDEGDWGAHPKGKFPHRYGVVGKVSWNAIGGHPFTGIFAGGGEGLVRLGSGLHNREYTIPGLALKLPVAGRPSLDIAALYRAEGQGSDGDFFRNRLRTRVPAPSRPANTDSLAARIFVLLQRGLERNAVSVLDDANREGSPRRLPLEHLAAVTQDGAEVSDPRAPSELELVPTPEVRAAFTPPADDADEPQLLAELAKLTAPLPLYRLYGIERGGDEGDERWEIGELRLETDLIRSRGGDLNLHFQHFYPRTP